jgi:hypothetical protein
LLFHHCHQVIEQFHALGGYGLHCLLLSVSWKRGHRCPARYRGKLVRAISGCISGLLRPSFPVQMSFTLRVKGLCLCCAINFEGRDYCSPMLA